MDPLTPNKIQRLMHLAEDSSFNKRAQEEYFKCHVKPLGHHLAALHNTDSGACESSSGLLDLDQIQGFGESDAGSVGKTTGFFPAEITGRSTGAEDNISNIPMGLSNSFMDIAKKVDKQSIEVKNLVRHSIATNFSIHSKNLTASEASFVAKHAPMPQQQANTTILEPSMTNLSLDSIGGYFRDRCPDFSNVLGHTDSPERSSMQPSLTEVSHFEQLEPLQKCPCVDPSLDSVPVRQPRILNEADELEKRAVSQHEQIKQLLMNPFTSQDHRMMTEDGSQNVDPFKKPSLAVPKLEPQKPKMAPTGSSNEYLVKAVTRASIKPATADDELSTIDNSLSLSKIAEFLGNQSVVNVSDIIDKYCKKDKTKPLLEANKIPKQELPVTYLKDTRNVDSANSAGSVKTVISMKANQENIIIPEVYVTRDSLTKNAQAEKESIKSETTRSKSPSSRSRSTLSTVQENYAVGVESPVRTSIGEVKPTHVPSPNFEYKELDQSVDWRDVMQQKSRRQSSLANKGPWIEIKTTSVKGFVGVNCTAPILITTKSESWLTATFNYDRCEATKLLRIELPRQPRLLSPGKTEQLSLNITSNAELQTNIPFTIIVKDSSIDCEQEQNGSLSVDFKMPEVQAISSFGPNKVVFSPTHERTLLATTLVLLSDSPVDLQLSLSLSDMNNVFSLRHVQEIKMNEVNKALGTADEKHALSKLKKASTAVQLCRLTKGNAIRATVVFEAPALTEQNNELQKYQGAVVVKLIGVEASVKTVELNATVGVAKLRVSTPDNANFSKEPKTIHILNVGSLRGVWHAKLKIEDSRVFLLSGTTVELAPGESKAINVTYKGPEDVVHKAMLTFEESLSGTKTAIEIQGGKEKFPIKTSKSILSWVRSGRKEISLKNYRDKKILVRCDIVGDAYTIDVPGVEARGTSCIISFSPNECRMLPIVYAPTTHLPNAAILCMKIDKKDEGVKVKLFGCASADSLRWVGLATYGETALVRAVARSSIDLKLTNKSSMPAFVCARVNFNLQYMSLAASSRLMGARRLVAARGSHTLSLRVDWARLERRAGDARALTLATVTALSGPELTRHRILRILRDEKTGEVDTSLLPDNLKMLVGPFEGEEMDVDALLTDFEETEVSLVDLIGGLQELKAQIDLPTDLSEETIIIADDTVFEHHTLFE